MLLGRFYTFLCKLFYISRSRLPPWAVYFILMPWASAWGAFLFKAGLTRVGFRFFQVCALTRAGDFKFSQVLRPCVGRCVAISGPFLLG